MTSGKLFNEVFYDIEVPDAAGDGPRYKEQSLRIFCVMTPPTSWSLPRVLEDVEVSESFMKIGHQKACQDSTCPPSLFLESWRTWRVLMHLVMVSDG